MLAISLMRMGAKGKPFYRVVVKEKRSKRDGKYLENLGTYNPMTDPSEVNLKHERIQYWISVGAQPTETVASLIKHNPVQTEEEKTATMEAKKAKVEADKNAKAAAKKAAADKIAAQKAEEEKAAADKAAAEAAEAAKAQAAEAQAAAEAQTAAENSATENSAVEETPAENPVEAPADETQPAAGE